MAGGDMLPLPPHFHPLQALWPSLFNASSLSLPSQQLAESLFDVAGFAAFATLYAFAISFVFPCPPHQPLMLGKRSPQMKIGGSALAARPDRMRVPLLRRLSNILPLISLTSSYMRFALVLVACAATNYLLWAYNVFCFLLPTVVPRIFEQDIASRAKASGSAGVEAANGSSGSKGKKGGKSL
ncbi:unnamed protein product [Closterium sp. Naga37s-1]|nr:unnamed protein product [Closterium sp. Naga37s-1]